MKNRTIRVIALASVLVLVIAGGVFLLTRNATVPVSPDHGTADGGSLSTDTNKPKLVRTYDLQTTEKREGNRMLESLMVVNDGRPAVVIEGQIRDLVTREVIYTLPDAVYNSGPLAEGQTRSSYFCIGPNQTIDAVHVDQGDRASLCPKLFL